MISSLLNKYVELPKVAKSTIWFTICNVVIAGIGFITAPIFTRLLPEKEFGILTLFMSYEQIILIFFTWELHLGAYQKGIFKYEDNVNFYTTSTLLLINLLTLVGSCIIIVFKESIMRFTEITNESFLFIIMYCLFFPAYHCWIVRKRTQYEYKSGVLVTLFYTVMNVLIPLLAVIYINNTAQVKFNASLLVSAFIGFYFYCISFSNSNILKDKRKIKEQWIFMVTFQAPLVLHSLSFFVLNQADRVMIGKMVGETQAAFYGVAYTLASVVLILQTSLNQALTPWRFEKLKKMEYTVIKSSTNTLLCLVAGLISIFILIAPEIMKFLFPESYYESVLCIPPISTGIFFMFLYSIFVNIESYYENTKYIMYVSVFCGVFNIVANYYCIPLFGYISSAYTSLLSYILFALLHYAFMKRICKKSIPEIKLFSSKTILMVSIILVCFSVLTTLLYSLILLRYLLLIIIVTLLFFYRKDLLMVLVFSKG